MPNRKRAEKWLGNEDTVAFEGRLSRLQWIQAKYPAISLQLFPGGLLSKYLFEEARYCFVYGQFLATVMLALAFVERVLAADLYGGGLEAAKKDRFQRLLEHHLERNTITAEEFAQIECARRNRNAVVHLRPPGHKQTLECRAFEEDSFPYHVLESDARNLLALVLRLIASWPFSV